MVVVFTHIEEYIYINVDVQEGYTTIWPITTPIKLAFTS